MSTLSPSSRVALETARPHPLTARPGRSRLWVAYRAVKGTWFIVLIHLGALAVVFTGATALDLVVLAGLVGARGLLVTVGLHRYSSHRSFKTGRVFQLALACLCCANLQRGPLRWAAIHRHHHRHSDDPHDAHSPV